jgi:hypothetical protein
MLVVPDESGHYVAVSRSWCRGADTRLSPLAGRTGGLRGLSCSRPGRSKAPATAAWTVAAGKTTAPRRVRRYAREAAQ